MNGDFLKLGDLNFAKVKVDVEEIRKFESEEDFMFLGVELLKEVTQWTHAISCSHRLDCNKDPRRWTRNEAILGGLMVRLSKLQTGILEMICQKKMELAFILFRCLAETVINLKYLLRNKSDELFEEYIKYSLREEKRLLNIISETVKERGYEIPIEQRMKKTIMKAFLTSGVNPEEVNEAAYAPWGEKLYRRAQMVEMDHAYYALMSIPSHFVHGNWQDLLSHHLSQENGEFTPRMEWGYPRPQILFLTCQISADVSKLYLNDSLSDCDDKNYINTRLDEFILRSYVVSELHEEFVQNGTEST